MLATTKVESYPLLLDRLKEGVSKFPSKNVFSFISPGVDGGRIAQSCTYQQLDNQTTLLAKHLLETGLQKGDR
jgi:acyl-CoA synthetase (AMP-forming)/AMP-acid ligase II